MNYVTRLIDYGKGHDDPGLDNMTLGQIADRIIEAAHLSTCASEKGTA